jgi:FKBP-type peptidyl-prolyl cis-trans isomerase SlyD
MVIENDKVVSVIYELKLAHGDKEIIEKVNPNRPLMFLYGRGNLLPKFESHLNGKKMGDQFDFVLTSEDAYGEFSNEAIVDIPKSIFSVDGEVDDNLLVLGNMIPMMDQSGNKFNGKVLELNTESVKMDFNHPLAGKSLHFKGEIVGIREATNEELEHGHLHGNQNGCEGCNSSDCESGCN